MEIIPASRNELHYASPLTRHRPCARSGGAIGEVPLSHNNGHCITKTVLIEQKLDLLKTKEEYFRFLLTHPSYTAAKKLC